MDPSSVRLAALGYITAIAIPPVGLILGIVLVMRPVPSTARVRHGWAVIAVTIIAALIWFLLLKSGIANTSSNDLN